MDRRKARGANKILNGEQNVTNISEKQEEMDKTTFENGSDYTRSATTDVSLLIQCSRAGLFIPGDRYEGFVVLVEPIDVVGR